MSLASSRVSRADSRIAVFLPSKPPATCVQRSSVSAASRCIRSSVARRLSLSSPSSLTTCLVAPWAAIARPRTSASLLSRFVSSAMPRTTRLGAPACSALREGERAGRAVVLAQPLELALGARDQPVELLPVQARVALGHDAQRVPPRELGGDAADQPFELEHPAER